MNKDKLLFQSEQLAEATKKFGSNPPNINAINMALGLKEGAVHKIFFKPTDMFITWLVEYANDRLIIDVGSGSGHLLNMIKPHYKRLIGIEPMFDYEAYVTLCMNYNKERIHMHPAPLSDSKGIIRGIEEKGLLVCARPSHNGMVREAIEIMHPDQELLYITKPINLKLYDDMGGFRNYANKIPLDFKIGSESEEIWSVKLR